MKFKTNGIVFNYIKFRESSVIVRVYTEKFGLKSYLINNVRSTKPKYPVSLFQPMTLLDMVVYNKPDSSLNRIVEIRCRHAFTSIPFHIVKSAVTLFLTEILFKIIQEEEPNSALFNFIENSFHVYDSAKRILMNFHLQFLIKLTGYLGIQPMKARDMLNEIKNEKPEFFLDKEDDEKLERLINADYLDPVSVHNKQRRIILSSILLFYRIHFSRLHEIKSLKILQEVFEMK